MATVAAVTAAATATGDTKLPYGIYHPCFMRLRQGSLFARSVKAMRKSPKGAAYRKGADGRRSIGRKEEIAGRTGQAGMPGHTGSTPEFRPNHDKAESRAHTGSEINRKRTIFRTNN